MNPLFERALIAHDLLRRTPSRVTQVPRPSQRLSLPSHGEPVTARSSSTPDPVAMPAIEPASPRPGILAA